MLSTTQHYTTLHNITQYYTRLHKTTPKNIIQLCIYRVACPDGPDGHA